MDIKTITVKHPNIEKRDITLLLVDGKVDIPSTEFLIHETRYGGRHGHLGGRTSHKGRAVKIAELYRNLHDGGISWRTATEVHIKAIRNAMLCWDNNDNEAHSEYDYEEISNDAMNHKLGVWFKFYKYMMKLGEPCDMTLSTKKVKKYTPEKMLRHLDYRTGEREEEYVEVWNLRVKSSPQNNVYRALSRTEFSKLRQHLRNIDIVYEMIALLMVETGLRISAALEVTEKDFEGILPLYSSKNTLHGTIEREYIAKGDLKRYYDLPLRTIWEIQQQYLTRIHPERAHKHLLRSERLTSSKYHEDALWILENGKEVKAHDIWKAFNEASKIMGRTTKRITPHWLRHTFATWTIMDIADRKGIVLENTGSTPNPIFISALQQKLGHASILSTMRYINTALKLMGIDVNDGVIRVSLRAFLRDKNSQKLVEREAKQEFGDEFDEEFFDVVKYALSRGIVVDDETLHHS